MTSYEPGKVSGAARDAGREDRGAPIADARELRRHVDEIIAAAPVVDMHTHLFAPQFGAMNLWGVDELLTYHYLVAELFRFARVAPAEFWAMEKARQADLIWETLFVRHTPLSEATRGVVAVLSALGLDPRARDLAEARAFFRSQRAGDYLDRVLEMSRVRSVVMTNDPFDENEVSRWDGGVEIDPRFKASLRIDPLLLGWDVAARKVAAQGFAVDARLGGDTFAEARRFLDKWVARMGPLYM